MALAKSLIYLSGTSMTHRGKLEWVFDWFSTRRPRTVGDFEAGQFLFRYWKSHVMLLSPIIHRLNLVSPRGEGGNLDYGWLVSTLGARLAARSHLRPARTLQYRHCPNYLDRTSPVDVNHQHVETWLKLHRSRYPPSTSFPQLFFLSDAGTGLLPGKASEPSWLPKLPEMLQDLTPRGMEDEQAGGSQSRLVQVLSPGNGVPPPLSPDRI